VNGGTITLGGVLGAGKLSQPGDLFFNGGTTVASSLGFGLNNPGTTLTFGGTTAGSLTVDAFDLSGGSVAQLLTRADIDWLPGTKMTLSVTNEVNLTPNWAETLWNAGALTYNGNGTNELNKTWAEVTAEDGLEAGARFDYDNDTKTLSLVSTAGSTYAQWTLGWGTNDIGAATNDYDLDGLNNLYEYALGGNPTNAAIQGSSPVFAKSGSGFIYVHPMRSDDTSLVYTVETRTNLLSGTWTNQGCTVTGTNVTGETLDFVTNDVDTVDNEKFIRLRIEQ
jgi:hypothetical protein